MNTENPTKINRLLQMTPSGVVLASHWLSQQGYKEQRGVFEKQFIKP